ncbi:MAG: 2-phospho-L-lactate guanylyltransferase [Alphaproteobacteria bacterium]
MTAAAIWAVLPLKPLAQAKQRLAPTLGPKERAGLSLAMATDVLATLTTVPALDGVLVVTADDALAALTAMHGARHLNEDTAAGYSEAVSKAAAQLAEEGAAAMICVPGDVPLVTASEIEALVAALAHPPAIALAPDAERDGTNALALAPPSLLAPQFGPASFARHRTAADAMALPATVLDLPGLALDIDTVDDLRALVARGPGGTTRAYLAEAGLLGRLSAA